MGPWSLMSVRKSDDKVSNKYYDGKNYNTTWLPILLFVILSTIVQIYRNTWLWAQKVYV